MSNGAPAFGPSDVPNVHRDSNCSLSIATDLDRVFPMTVKLPDSSTGAPIALSSDSNSAQYCSPEVEVNAQIARPYQFISERSGTCAWRFRCKMAPGRYPPYWWQAELLNEIEATFCRPELETEKNSKKNSSSVVEHAYRCKPNVRITQLIMERDGCSMETKALWYLRLHSLPASFSCQP